MKALDKFRILEYKDCFKVERLFEEKEYAWWDIFGFNPIINHNYRTITEQGEPLSISNLRFTLDRFDTKEEAEQWIEDFSKYPIYHHYETKIDLKVLAKKIQDLGVYQSPILRSTKNQEG